MNIRPTTLRLLSIFVFGLGGWFTWAAIDNDHEASDVFAHAIVFMIAAAQLRWFAQARETMMRIQWLLDRLKVLGVNDKDDLNDVFDTDPTNGAPVLHVHQESTRG